MHILFFLYLPNITKYFIFAKSVFRLYILWLCIYLSQLSMHIDAFQLHKLFLCNLFVLPKTNNYLLFLCLCSFLCSYHSSVLKLLKNSASALTTFPLVLTASPPQAQSPPAPGWAGYDLFFPSESLRLFFFSLTVWNVYLKGHGVGLCAFIGLPLTAVQAVHCVP